MIFFHFIWRVERSDAAVKLFDAGANTVYLYRLGTGGKEGSLSLQTTTATNAVTLKTKYPTALKFSVTVKQKLGDETTKECSVYNGATLVEKVSFIAGADVNEAANLVEAMKDSKYLSAELVSGASGIMQTVAQQALAGGSAPAVTTEDYSNAFNAFETYAWNVLVLDTVEEDVKALAKTSHGKNPFKRCIGCLRTWRSGRKVTCYKKNECKIL